MAAMMVMRIRKCTRAHQDWSADRVQHLPVRHGFSVGVGEQVGGNLWRTTDDISDSYRSMALIGFSQAGLERTQGRDTGTIPTCWRWATEACQPTSTGRR